MFKRFVLLAALAVAVVPAAASAEGTTTTAQQQCTKLRASIGAAQFASSFSTLGACVSKLATLDAGNAASANAQCQAEQADAGFASTHGGKTFEQTYGNGKAGKNAFGNCVSAKTKSAVAVEQAATPNPSQACKAERTRLGATQFAAAYRTLGKCVSKLAKAQVGNEAKAAAQCRADASVMSSTEPDAYAKCVVAKTHALNAARHA